jgi:hypothetical protein
MGRPSNYPPDLCELAHNYCLLGATNDVLAELFGVSPRTIDNWIAGHPEFAEAVQQGRDVADATAVEFLPRASSATTTRPRRSSFIAANPGWRPTPRMFRPKPGPVCSGCATAGRRIGARRRKRHLKSLAEIAGIPDQAAPRAGHSGR